MSQKKFTFFCDELPNCKPIHIIFGSSGGARMSRQPGHFQVTKVVRQVIRFKPKRQRSKGAKSFRGQKILKPGHRMRFFPQKS